jgi:CheY-like chemotaxis protein
MRIIKNWLRLLRSSNGRQSPHRTVEGGAEGPSCFEAWIHAYRQRLDHECVEQQASVTPQPVRATPARISKRDTSAIVPRTAIVALVVNPEDRKVLTDICEHELWKIHFATSREEAWDAVSRLHAPVILFDRDWPNEEWRTAVQSFASSPHRSCVLLASRVADDYLWQELIRYGGYDLLAKPFRAGEVTRALKLAFSFWITARSVAQ